MWKRPQRPLGEVTQDFNDGLVQIYSVRDVATPGYAPEEKTELKGELRYEERRLGIQRFYAAQQNQIQIERVIRVPRLGKINNQDLAKTEDGVWYRIDQVQTTEGVYPPSLDLTLTKTEQRADDELV